MKIKVEPFLMKKGNRVAKAGIEFESTDGILAGWHLVGFTICDDKEKGLLVLFPSTKMIGRDGVQRVGTNSTFFFLRPSDDDQISNLETLILDAYEEMVGMNRIKPLSEEAPNHK